MFGQIDVAGLKVSDCDPLMCNRVSLPLITACTTNLNIVETASVVELAFPTIENGVHNLDSKLKDGWEEG